MKHSWGHKLVGNCYAGKRRLNPLEYCTAYLTYENTSVSTIIRDNTQYNIPTTKSPTSKFDPRNLGFRYNVRYEPVMSFKDYYFDTADVDLWNERGINCFMGLCEMYFTGPTYINNLCVVPLKRHPEKPDPNPEPDPEIDLKKGRVEYEFLDANSTDILNDYLIDPMHFTGVWPYTPSDPETVQKVAGWMYSNKAVLQPYQAVDFYEDSESTINRSTATSTQLNWLPFKDELKVYDIEENEIGKFDGLAFIVFFGEQHFNLPFNTYLENCYNPETDTYDAPCPHENEYVDTDFSGLIFDPTTDPPQFFDPTLQYYGAQVNIYLTGNGIKSPKIGSMRFYAPNRGEFYDPAYNYFNVLFERGLSTSYIIPFDFKILPSQGGGTQIRHLPLSNLKLNIGA